MMSSKDNNRTFQSKFELDSEAIWVTDFETENAIEFCEKVEQAYQDNPLKPIIININSFGGAVDGLLMMTDCMDAIRSVADSQFFYFVTHAVGKAYSAAAALLAYGDVRFASPRTRIMLHQVLGGAYGSHPDMEVEYEEVSRVNSQLLTLIAEACKFKGSVEELRQYLQRDKYFSAEEALDFGVIDIVGTPKINEIKLFELGIVNHQKSNMDAVEEKLKQEASQDETESDDE